MRAAANWVQPEHRKVVTDAIIVRLSYYLILDFLI